MKFSRVIEFFEEIDGTSLRNEKTKILARLLGEAEKDEIEKIVYLALGGLRPKFDRLEFQMAQMLILRAIGATNEQYQKVGDLGEMVTVLISEQVQKHKNVERSVSEVYEELVGIASEEGSGSQERKVAQLGKLIRESDPQSAKYIVRMVDGKMRLGFSDKTVLDALSYMENGTKEYSEALERAYQVRPDVGVLSRVIKEKGVEEGLRGVSVSIGTPIMPALAQRLKTAKEMIEKMGRVYCEPKFDGTRVSIHFKRSGFNKSESMTLFGETDIQQVKTFTRNLDESTNQFPELKNIAEQIRADEVILDCEAVGYDPQSGKLVPFQLTITRKRKHGVAEMASSVPLRFFVFDIMYRDGESLIHLPLSKRRKILAETVIMNRKVPNSGPESLPAQVGSEPGEETLVVDDFIETDDPDVLREYHKKQLEAGLEGAVVKQVEGQYMPGRTGFNWVKFKESEDSRAKLADTIDCVIMGYYKGRGKRSDFTLGAFLVGVRREEGGESQIVTLAKVGTGITDQVFGELGKRLKKIGARREEIGDYVIPKALEPDVWVEPKIVVEVAADEITISPTHSAGYALRFPRLVKLRDDKSVGEITKVEEVKEMYEL